MELRHLETFGAIVSAGSFQRAAERLGYAQSTITLHVQQLEAELGVKLFARRGKRMALTDAGRALCEQADALLQRAEALQRTMAEIVAGEAGHVRLGAIEPAASVRLPPLLVRYCEARPRVRLTLEVGGAQAISRGVAAGDLDIAICSPPAAHLGLSFEPLFAERMALLLPDDHPLAARERIALADLTGQRLLLSERTCAYREAIEKALIPLGANPYSGIEIGSVGAMRRAVQGGLGAAILPVCAANPPPRGTTLRQFDDVELALPVGLIHRAGEEPAGRALEALVAAIRAELAEPA
jgi:LysR family transcriptional regulator, regulator of the ytmI operon